MQRIGPRWISCYEIPAGGGGGGKTPSFTGLRYVADVGVHLKAFCVAWAKTAVLEPLYWHSPVDLAEAAIVWLSALKPGHDFLVNARSVWCYVEYKRSYLAARVAEALAYRMLTTRYGYALMARFPAWLECIALHQRYAPSLAMTAAARAHYVRSRYASRQPDFVLQDSGGAFALAESKGQLARLGDSSGGQRRARRAISDALKQLAAGRLLLAELNQPVAAEYAVFTLVAEAGRRGGSQVWVCDPPGEDERGEHQYYLAESLRRAVYGHWLQVMGLVAEGRALLEGGTVRGPIRVPVWTVKDQDTQKRFCFVHPPDQEAGEWLPLCRPHRYWCPYRHGPVVPGLERDRLLTLLRLVSPGFRRQGEAFPLVPEFPLVQASTEEERQGLAVTPDGSVMADTDDLSRHEREVLAVE